MTKAYVFLLGFIILLFVTVGIGAFYTEPNSPTYPEELNYIDGGPSKYTQEQKALDERYKADQKTFQEKDKVYSRNVSIVSLGIGVILFLLCFLFISTIPFLATSLQFGSFGTIIYGIIRGFMSENMKVEFIAIAVILVVLLATGLYKFKNMPATKSNLKQRS